MSDNDFTRQPLPQGTLCILKVVGPFEQKTRGPRMDENLTRLEAEYRALQALLALSACYRDELERLREPYRTRVELCGKLTFIRQD